MNKEEIKEICLENGLHPFFIGIEILKKAGYNIDFFGHGYNSLAWEIKDEDGNITERGSIGD